MKSKLFPGLTLKQTKFTNTVVKQIREEGKINLVRAAKQSLDTTTYNSSSAAASELLENPKIRQTIQEALNVEGLTSSVIAGGFKHLAAQKPEKVSADVVLRSLIEVSKLMGAYPTQKHANVSLSVKANLSNMQYDDLEHELSRIDDELKSLMNNKSKLPEAT